MGMPVITPGTTTREKAVGDIISSISMEEAALAHILNAESEKLQAVINSAASTPKQLFDVNCSVRNTVDAITRLEMVLQAKLELFKGTICKQ